MWIPVVEFDMLRVTEWYRRQTATALVLPTCQILTVEKSTAMYLWMLTFNLEFMFTCAAVDLVYNQIYSSKYNAYLHSILGLIL